MSVYYETEFHIGAGETGLYGQCRPSGVMGILQEAATDAGCALHVSGPEMLEKYHAIWMVARIRYQLARPLRWDERVTVRTWHRGDKGAALYRDFDLRVNGRPVGEAVATWVLADLDSRRLLRMSRLEEARGTDGGELCRSGTLSRLRLPETMALAERRRFGYSDTDVNGHVNNVKYADYIADALRLEELLEGSFVSSLQIGYLHECRAGETVGLYTGREGGTYFVHGADEAGVSRFDGALTLEPLPG